MEMESLSLSANFPFSRTQILSRGSNPPCLSIHVLVVELRDDILDQVNKLYFERLRVKSELDNLALEDRSKRFDKQLKLAELTASLDSLTSGYYSKQLRLLAQELQS